MLSVSPWLTVPACSSCSRSIELTWLRRAHLEITSVRTSWYFSPYKRTPSYNPSTAPKLMLPYIRITSVAFRSAPYLPKLWSEHWRQLYTICVHLGLISRSAFTKVILTLNSNDGHMAKFGYPSERKPKPCLPIRDDIPFTETCSNPNNKQKHA